MTDTIKASITYLTAAVIAIGALIGAVFVWLQPVNPDPALDRDLALILGFLGTAFGAASTFLFLGESRTAQARATERAVDVGGTLGAAMPGQALYGGLGVMPEAVEDEYEEGSEPDIDVEPTTGIPTAAPLSATGTGSVRDTS